ncbi:small-conductance mechanosensitive channel [Rhodopirellula rubra]|uniref:Small-conductance mechanosensitive channel n=1 Tax=Aporhodopirellula rubra TaxID=980271 RepID=A0A7W5H888_9BACT|nr:mechanosensitive ion channel family protein [Aporhodopirellula rubra]MBB3209184.1 small-conductance mechanosensitive channel [Aporhodopirellula rubra]
MSLIKFCHSLVIAVAIAAQLAATPTHGQEAVPPDDLATANETISVDGVIEDAAIVKRLTAVFKATGWFSETNVQCESGIVTLSGVADTEERREWAEKLADRTQDVIAVVNQLSVDDSTIGVDLTGSATAVEASLDDMWRDFLTRSPLLFAALIVVVLTALFAKAFGWLLVKLLNQRRMRTSLKDLFYQLAAIGTWIVGLLIATIVAFPGMTPSKALAVLGLGSVAVGFAFKDIFENFFAGILILWRYPFDRGDFISTGDLTGKVEEVTIRNTMIRRLDGELAVVPNATIFKNTVDVLTDQPQRRVRIVCGVAYDEDLATARDVISEAVQSCETVQAKRTVQVFANEFAESSINFEVVWWTGSKPVDVRRSRDEVVTAIKGALDNAGIEIPFPYRTLTFKNVAVAQTVAAAVNNCPAAAVHSTESSNE